MQPTVQETETKIAELKAEYARLANLNPRFVEIPDLMAERMNDIDEIIRLYWTENKFNLNKYGRVVSLVVPRLTEKIETLQNILRRKGIAF
jgi:hypothetical protein